MTDHTTLLKIETALNQLVALIESKYLRELWDCKSTLFLSSKPVVPAAPKSEQAAPSRDSGQAETRMDVGSSPDPVGGADHAYEAQQAAPKALDTSSGHSEPSSGHAAGDRLNPKLISDAAQAVIDTIAAALPDGWSYHEFERAVLERISCSLQEMNEIKAMPQDRAASPWTWAGDELPPLGAWVLWLGVQHADAGDMDEGEAVLVCENDLKAVPYYWWMPIPPVTSASGGRECAPEQFRKFAELRASVEEAPMWRWCPDNIPPVGSPVIILDQGMPLADAEVHIPTGPWHGVECWWMPFPAPPEGWAEFVQEQPGAEHSANLQRASQDDSANLQSRTPQVSQSEAAGMLTLPAGGTITLQFDTSPGDNKRLWDALTRPDLKEDPTMDALQTGGQGPAASDTIKNPRMAHQAHSGLLNRLNDAAELAGLLDLLSDDDAQAIFDAMAPSRRQALLCRAYALADQLDGAIQSATDGLHAATFGEVA